MIDENGDSKAIPAKTLNQSSASRVESILGNIAEDLYDAMSGSELDVLCIGFRDPKGRTIVVAVACDQAGIRLRAALESAGTAGVDVGEGATPTQPN